MLSKAGTLKAYQINGGVDRNSADLDLPKGRIRDAVNLLPRIPSGAQVIRADAALSGTQYPLDTNTDLFCYYPAETGNPEFLLRDTSTKTRGHYLSTAVSANLTTASELAADTALHGIAAYKGKVVFGEQGKALRFYEGNSLAAQLSITVTGAQGTATRTGGDALPGHSLAGWVLTVGGADYQITAHTSGANKMYVDGTPATGAATIHAGCPKALAAPKAGLASEYRGSLWAIGDDTVDTAPSITIPLCGTGIPLTPTVSASGTGTVAADGALWKITDSGAAWSVDAFIGKVVWLEGSEAHLIVDNSATVLWITSEPSTLGSQAYSVEDLPLAAYPNTVDFGVVRVFGDSGPVTVRFHNIGTGSVRAVAARVRGVDWRVVDAPNFPQTIPPGSSLAVKVMFQPQSKGYKQSELILDHDFESQGSVAVACSGYATHRAVTASPSVIDFGEYVIGQTSPQIKLSIRNPMVDPITISAWTEPSGVTSEAGDAANQMSGWSFSGANPNNTNGGLLYWSLDEVGGTYFVSIYKDSAGANKVAEGTRATASGSVTLAEQNASGLTGSVTIAYTGDDTTLSANILTLGSFDVIEADVQNTVIPPGESLTVNLTFTPYGEGTATASISFVRTRPARMNRLFKSAIGDHLQWNLDEDWEDFDENLGSSGYPKALANYDDRLYVFLESDVVALIHGGTNAYRKTTLATGKGRGAMCQQAVCTGGGSLWWVAKDGIFRLTGSEIEEIGIPIRDIVKAIPEASFYLVRTEFYDDCLWVWLPNTTTSDSVAASLWVFHKDYNSWWRVYDSTNAQTIRALTVQRGKDDKEVLVAAYNAATGKAITGVSKANPTVITAVAHGLATGDRVALAGIVGTGTPNEDTLLNGLVHVVTVTGVDTFTVPVDMTGGNDWVYTPATGTATLTALKKKDSATNGTDSWSLTTGWVGMGDPSGEKFLETMTVHTDDTDQITGITGTIDHGNTFSMVAEQDYSAGAVLFAGIGTCVSAAKTIQDDSSPGWTVNQWATKAVEISGEANRTVSSNTADTLTLDALTANVASKPYAIVGARTSEVQEREFYAPARAFGGSFQLVFSGAKASAAEGKVYGFTADIAGGEEGVGASGRYIAP